MQWVHLFSVHTILKDIGTKLGKKVTQMVWQEVVDEGVKVGNCYTVYTLQSKALCLIITDHLYRLTIEVWQFNNFHISIILQFIIMRFS